MPLINRLNQARQRGYGSITVVTPHPPQHCHGALFTHRIGVIVGPQNGAQASSLLSLSICLPPKAPLAQTAACLEQYVLCDFFDPYLLC